MTSPSSRAHFYRLRYDPGVESAYSRLPARDRERLTMALADACCDPLGATRPFGVDDEVMRLVDIGHASAVLLVHHTPPLIAVVRIDTQVT